MLIIKKILIKRKLFTYRITKFWLVPNIILSLNPNVIKKLNNLRVICNVHFDNYITLLSNNNDESTSINFEKELGSDPSNSNYLDTVYCE